MQSFVANANQVPFLLGTRQTSLATAWQPLRVRAGAEVAQREILIYCTVRAQSRYLWAPAPPFQRLLLQQQLHSRHSVRTACLKGNSSINVMAAVTQRVRLYSALLAKSAQVVSTQLYRYIWTQEQCPLGWPGYQEWCVAMMKTLFEVGSYNHWRNFIKLMMVSFNVPELELTVVPPTTFTTKGFRRSWWVDLKPELQPVAPRATIVLMYLHGGAFMAGDPLMYKPAYLLWMQQLAAQGIKMRVFAVGYPLAPEHPFPSGLEGVVEAYDWLVGQLGGSENIILGGDSAGGNLTITALAYMRDRAKASLNLAGIVAAPAGEEQQQQQQQQQQVPFEPPLAAIMISPATDFTSSSVFRKRLPEGTPSSKQQTQGSSARSTSNGSSKAASSSNGNGNDADELFKWDYVSRGEGDDVIKLYLPVPHDPQGLSHPLVSPILQESFSGLVRKELLVVTGGCEAMVPDIIRFVDKVKTASPELPVAHHIENNEPHCYCVLSMGHLLRKGAAVVVPFLAKVASSRGA